VGNGKAFMNMLFSPSVYNGRPLGVVPLIAAQALVSFINGSFGFGF
jgi:hypothetical protein